MIVVVGLDLGLDLVAPGGVDLLASVLSTYDELGRKAIKDAAQRWLAQDRWTVVWSLPEDAPPWRPKWTKPRRSRKKRASAASTADGGDA